MNIDFEKRHKQRRKLDRLIDRTLMLAQLEEKETPKALAFHFLVLFLILSTTFVVGMAVGYLT